jgi:hypothetical protein
MWKHPHLRGNAAAHPALLMPLYPTISHDVSSETIASAFTSK